MGFRQISREERRDKSSEDGDQKGRELREKEIEGERERQTEREEE